MVSSAVCAKVLDGAFCEHEGSYYCVDDYKSKFLPKCAGSYSHSSSSRGGFDSDSRGSSASCARMSE